MTEAPPLRQLIELELAGHHLDLDDELRWRRAEGQTLQHIANWIIETTGRSVTAETIRRWHQQLLDSS